MSRGGIPRGKAILARNSLATTNAIGYSLTKHRTPYYGVVLLDTFTTWALYSLWAMRSKRSVENTPIFEQITSAIKSAITTLYFITSPPITTSSIYSRKFYTIQRSSASNRCSSNRPSHSVACQSTPVCDKLLIQQWLSSFVRPLYTHTHPSVVTGYIERHHATVRVRLSRLHLRRYRDYVLWQHSTHLCKYHTQPPATCPDGWGKRPIIRNFGYLSTQHPNRYQYFTKDSAARCTEAWSTVGHKTLRANSNCRCAQWCTSQNENPCAGTRPWRVISWSWC